MKPRQSKAKTPEQKEAGKIKRGYSIGWIDPEIRGYITEIRSLPCVDPESGGTIFSCAGFGKHANSADPEDYRMGRSIENPNEIQVFEHEPGNIREYGDNVYWGYVIVVYDPQYPWERVHQAVSEFDTKRVTDRSVSQWSEKLRKPVKMYDLIAKSPEELKRKWESLVSKMSSACSVSESFSLNRWQVLARIR